MPRPVTAKTSTPTDLVPDAPPEGTNHVSIEVEPEPRKTVFADLPEKVSFVDLLFFPSLMSGGSKFLTTFDIPRSYADSLLDTASLLEPCIERVRRDVCGYYSSARARVRSVMDRWIHVEPAVKCTFIIIISLCPPWTI